MQEPIPGYNGGGNYLANVGRIDNKGLDFSINAHLIQTKDWQWNSTLTGTYLKNEVKSLGSNEYIYGKTPADKMADEATRDTASVLSTDIYGKASAKTVKTYMLT